MPASADRLVQEARERAGASIDAALGNLHTALAVDPDHVAALALLSQFQYQHGRFDAAHVPARRAVTLAPDDGDAWRTAHVLSAQPRRCAGRTSPYPG